MGVSPFSNGFQSPQHQIDPLLQLLLGDCEGQPQVAAAG